MLGFNSLTAQKVQKVSGSPGRQSLEICEMIDIKPYSIAIMALFFRLLSIAVQSDCWNRQAQWLYKQTNNRQFLAVSFLLWGLLVKKRSQSKIINNTMYLHKQLEKHKEPKDHLLNLVQCIGIDWKPLFNGPNHQVEWK